MESGTSVIQTRFDAGLGVFVVEFPEFVTLNCLRQWGEDFLLQLESHSNDVALLLDTNQHNFDSVDCLKWLRTFLMGEPIAKSKICRVAFVQPPKYRCPEVVSDGEAYFTNTKEAQRWLQSIIRSGKKTRTISG